MYKQDLALNHLQWLVCPKNKANKPNSVREIFEVSLKCICHFVTCRIN